MYVKHQGESSTLIIGGGTTEEQEEATEAIEAAVTVTPAQRMEKEGNSWKLDDKGNLVLPMTAHIQGRGHPDDDLYWIPADRITDDEAPDWLAQVSEKSWATHEILGGLCRALELLLGFRQKRLAPLA